MHRNAAWLGLVIAAAAGGYFAGMGEGPGAPARSEAPRSATPPAAEAPLAPQAPEPEPAPAAPVAGDVREMLRRELGEAPDETRVEDVATRAEKKRRAHLAGAENAEAEAAREVAEEIRRERVFLEDKARGGTMELLRNLDTQLPDLVGDDKRFGALLERHGAGPLLNAAPSPNETLENGTTISFPPGVHGLQLPRTRRFPRDILVQGSGMDATLVRFAELGARDEVHSLTFRDMTIACGSYFTDLRNSPASIRLERCRVVGFDKGSGLSVMVKAPQLAFYATDCRFEAVGRSPGSGNLFQLKAGLVRLDRCVIQGPLKSIYNADSRATYLFSKCDIRDAPAEAEPGLKSPPNGVRFVECTFAYLPRGVTAPTTSRPLSDLNPNWPAK